jgi:hypothetical protein
MADDRLAVAVDIVAKRVIHTLLHTAEAEDQWENYPQVGLHDWQEVEARIARLADEINPDDETFKAAYEFLDARADAE